MTFEEVKTALRQMNVHPWQIFTMEDIKNDKVFGKLFDEQNVLSEKYKDLETKYKSLESENTEAVKNLNKTKAKDMLDGALKEGFTDKQKTFILKRFRPEDFDEINTQSINKYIENTKKEYAETAKLFGITDDADNPDKDKQKDKINQDKTPEEEALELMGVKE
ncbi:MAG TPA: hypothetical protein ENH23_01065 [candidate division Zixibacteria bacterium]|nr:hypothetical protein [candidate division Zixibacteria bacterium]